MEKVYVSGAYVSSVLVRNNNNQWINFGNLFRNDRATQKEEGLYIILVFVGNVNSGHWLFNIVQWKDNICQGLTFNSLAIPQEEERSIIRNKTIDCFGRNNLVGWEEVACT